ncbi:hypothetical protein Tco_0040211 [Tanacetum coccineum]
MLLSSRSHFYWARYDGRVWLFGIGLRDSVAGLVLVDKFTGNIRLLVLLHSVVSVWLALFGGGTYFELLVYIPEASTLGFSEAVDPLLFLPLSSVFSLAFLQQLIMNLLR